MSACVLQENPSLLEPVTSSLASIGRSIIVAEPGAGKSTEIPLTLSRDARFSGKTIWVVQPRRLAATSLANYVAGRGGQRVGQQVGFIVRGKRMAEHSAKVLYVTGGIALRKYSEIRKNGLLILDEFHERRIDTDILLALAKRDSLPTLIMSATLDTELLSDYLGGAAVHNIPGKTFPLEKHYQQPSRDVVHDVCSKVREIQDTHFNTLVFLPTVSIIEQVRRKLSNLNVSVLHGGLNIDQQGEAVSEVGGRAVLATNIAETSVTVPLVDRVIDTGLRNRVTDTRWGKRADVTTIAQTSALQRAGRAARQKPGTVHCLYTKAQFESWPFDDPPEITTSDLTQPLLLLLQLGENLEALQLLTPPPTNAVQEAKRVLSAMGAIDSGGITGLGRKISGHPLSVRAACVLELAREQDGVAEGPALAALLDTPLHQLLRRDKQRHIDAPLHDPLVLVDDLMTRKSPGPFRASGFYRYLGLLRDLKTPNKASCNHSLAPDAEQRWLLHAYGDCLASRVGDTQTVRLYDGDNATLPSNFAPDKDIFVVSEIQARGSHLEVAKATPTSRELVFEECFDLLEDDFAPTWNSAKQRVGGESRVKIGEVIIEKRQISIPTPEQRQQLAKVLFDNAKKRPLDYFFASKHNSIDRLKQRCQLAGLNEDALGYFDEESLWQRVEQSALAALSLDDIVNANLYEQLWADLAAHWSSLDRLAPEIVALPGRKRVPVHYAPGKEPWIESRIQDFFGLTSGPTIGVNKTPLLLHLLAPNGRPVQVTKDLASFWQNHYPDIRKELKRRYSKHQWPEDPLHR